MEKHASEISWTSLWRVFTFVLLVAIFYLGRQIILGLFLAIIISSGLEGLVDILEKSGLPRTISVIMIFLLALFVIVLVVYALIPIIVVELNTIFSGISRPAVGGWSFLLNLKASQSAGALINKVSSDLFSGNTSPLEFFSNAIGGFGLAVAVIVSSFYLSINKDGVERFIKVVFPPDYEPAALRIYDRSRKQIGNWFRTQILLSLIMGFSVWGGLTVLGVKHAFLIGIFAAIFEIVPFVGPIISGAIAVISALATSTTLAFYVLIFFLVVQQFESNILVPMLTRRAVGLHPVIVITSLLIGAEVGGLLGVVIAVPAAAVFQEVIEQWSIKRRAPQAP